MDTQPSISSGPAQSPEQLPQPEQRSRKKLFILIGAAVSILVVAILLITALVSKTNADARAAEYQQAAKAYVASLSTKDGKTIKGDVDNAPKLETTALSFLSANYQQASAKQAALNEDLRLIKEVNDGYTYLKDDIRRTLFYDQSTFFFDRYSARTEAYVNYEADMSDNAYAKMVIKQYTAEAKVGKEYLDELDKPVSQKLHDPEITKLRQVLKAYIDKATSCAAAAKQKPSEAEARAADCNKQLTRFYYDTMIHYDFIAYFPYSLKKATPMTTLLASLEQHQSNDYADASAEKARLKAIINTRVALIKTLLPTTNKDKEFGPKADIVRAFNGQIADAIDAANVSAETKSAYKQKLAIITTSLTMYDNPFGGNDGPDDAGGFVGSLADIISTDEPYDRDNSITQHYAHHTEQLKKLKELKTPEYVKDEMKKVIAIYESSSSYFKESDELSKKSAEATKLAKEKSGSFDAVDHAINAYKYTVQSNNKYYGGEAAVKKANSSVTTIGKKLDDVKTMTKQVIAEYDDLLAVN